MTVPFRVDPESGRRPAQQDPFMEFDSERPSRSLLGPEPGFRPPQQDFLNPPTPPIPDRAVGRRDASAISPTFAFALGVAGLVTAAVGYYQMGQVLSDRSRAQTAQVDAAPSAPTAAATAPAPTVGRLEVVSDPAGASVTLDGAAIGVTPITLTQVKPGTRQVVLAQGASRVTRSVRVTAGGTAVVSAVLAPPASGVTPPGAPAPSSNAGWVTFQSPIELRVLERGRPRGSTADRLSMTEGAYEFELVNEMYEVRQTISARVGAARGTLIDVPLPSGSLSINALPWADVWVDGTPVGTTPLANLSLKVGTHDVVWRHPTLGERQQKVLVKAVTPARVGVNMNNR